MSHPLHLCLSIREMILSHDPYVMDLAIQRFENYASRHRFKPMFTELMTKDGIKISVSATLSAWFMKFVIIKFELHEESHRMVFSGHHGYAYAMVGKHNLCQWLRIEKVHRDVTDLYDLFLDRPTKLSGLLRDNLQAIREKI